jgi:hypothetical protein
VIAVNFLEYNRARAKHQSRNFLLGKIHSETRLEL